MGSICKGKEVWKSRSYQVTIVTIRGSLDWEEMGNGVRNPVIRRLLCFTRAIGFDRGTGKLADSLRDAGCRVWLRGST